MPIVLKPDIDLGFREWRGTGGALEGYRGTSKRVSEGVIAADDKGDLSVMGVSAERSNLCAATHPSPRNTTIEHLRPP
jgi:hypothetical protein